MTKLLIAMVIASFALLGAAMAQGTSCESKAVDKNGKALVGAAKTSFLTKCRREACEPKAVDKNGKALTGAAVADRFGTRPLPFGFLERGGLANLDAGHAVP